MGNGHHRRSYGGQIIAMVQESPGNRGGVGDRAGHRRWTKSKSEAEYLHLLRTDEWEVVIPEIITRRSL